MPIKQRNTITKRDFEDALDYLNVSVSEVAKASGIPRAYLSDLKTRSVPLRRENDEKLRAYLQGQGVEFEENGQAPADDEPGAPHPALRTETVTRCFFPIAENLDQDVIERVIGAMDKNDARLNALLSKQAERKKGFTWPGPACDGERTNATNTARKEIETLFAENYVLFRMLCGWRALNGNGDANGIETLRDLVMADYRPRLIEAGLISPEAEPVEKAEEETS